MRYLSRAKSSSEDVVAVAPGRWTSKGGRDGGFYYGSDCSFSSGREYLLFSHVIVFSEGSGWSIFVLYSVSLGLVSGVRGSRVTLISDAIRDTSRGGFGRGKVEDRGSSFVTTRTCRSDEFY